MSVRTLILINPTDGVALGTRTKMLETVKVVRDGAGDIIVTGAAENEMLTIKYSGADGSVLWQRRYNGPAAKGLAVDRVCRHQPALGRRLLPHDH